jgi:hypothetical protein
MHFEILVEEPSAEAMLVILLSRFFDNGTHSYKIITHQGKMDLLSQLPSKLRAYAKRVAYDPMLRVLVVIDKDAENCFDLKQKLNELGVNSGMITKGVNQVDDSYNLVNRIAVEELEAWFFGDPVAVISAYPRVRSTHFKPRHRTTDNIQGGTWEAFERLLQQAGYFKSGLRKIECANAIATFMNPTINLSPSFICLWRELAPFGRA